MKNMNSLPYYPEISNAMDAAQARAETPVDALASTEKAFRILRNADTGLLNHYAEVNVWTEDTYAPQPWQVAVRGLGELRKTAFSFMEMADFETGAISTLMHSIRHEAEHGAATDAPEVVYGLNILRMPDDASADGYAWESVPFAQPIGWNTTLLGYASHIARPRELSEDDEALIRALGYKNPAHVFYQVMQHNRLYPDQPYPVPRSTLQHLEVPPELFETALANRTAQDPLGKLAIVSA